MPKLTVFSELYSLKNEYNNNTLTQRNNLLQKMEEELVDLANYDDIQLAERIYGEDHNASTYRSLKSRLKNQLIQDLLNNTATSGRNQLRAKREQLQKEYAAFQIAIYNSKVAGAQILAEQILKRAIKYHMSEVVVGTSYHLYQQHVFYRLSPSKSKKYLDIYNRYQKILALERDAKIRYSELSIMLKKKRMDHTSIVEFCKKTFELKKDLGDEIQSFDSNRFLYLTSCVGHYFDKDLQGIDETATEALEYLHSLPFQSLPVESQFRRWQVRARLLQGEYRSGVITLNEIIEVTDPKTIGWFNSYQLLIQIFLMTAEYGLAIENYEEVKANRGFKTLPQIFKNDWLVLEAYLNFLQLQNRALGKPTMTRFRINRFINSYPELTESKKMYNIQLIVAQLLFYFHDQRYSKIEERISAISKYTSRYLKKNETYRSQVFIKMLAEIPRNNYSRTAIQRHTKKFMQRLLDHPSSMDLGIENIEIIPYEKLWEMILAKLKR